MKKLHWFLKSLVNFNKIYGILLYILLGLWQPLVAIEKRSVLTFSPGIDFNNYQELLISALSQVGRASGGLVGYHYIDNFQFHFIQTDAGFGRPIINETLATNISRTNTDWKASLNISYGALFNVYHGKDSHLYLGVGLEDSIDVWIINRFQEYALGNNLTFGSQLAFIYERPKHYLRIYHYLPFIGLWSPPCYNTCHEDLIEIIEGNSEFLNSLFHLSPGNNTYFSWQNAFNTIIRLEYEWKSSARIGVFVRTKASFLHNPSREAPNRTTVSYDFFSGLALHW